MNTVFTSATEVAAEIKSRLQAISTTADVPYLTNIGAAVYQGKVGVDDDMPPCISIREGDDHVESTPGRSALWQIAQKYALVSYGPCDPDDPNVAAHRQIKDMKRAIFSTNGKPDAKFGGKVQEVHYLGRTIGPRADGKPIVMAIVDIEVVYVESLALPA